MQYQHNVNLAPYTTTRVGGPASSLVEVQTENELIEAVQQADSDQTPLLLVGGGSNLLISDDGFEGLAIVVRSEGAQVDSDSACAGASVTVAAGHSWDDFVKLTVAEGWSGLEALSGIPGSAGATPIQNVGAYGHEVAETIAKVHVWDREQQQRRDIAVADLAFAYRDSLLKRSFTLHGPRYVVLNVTFQLPHDKRSAPITYSQLAGHLEVEQGARVESVKVREAVLALRASKGMVLDKADHDTWSTGSFFTNPLLTPEQAAGLPVDAPRFPAGNLVKTSAAWLIDHAGFGKGFRIADSAASLSTKHVLALTNRGDAKAQQLVELARAVRAGVLEKYGIELVPEPQLVGHSL